MNKISATKLVNFRRSGKRAKKNFATWVVSKKIVPPEDGGGDYWIHSIPAIGRSYKEKSYDEVDDQIDILKEKISNSTIQRSKDMFQRNIVILENYKKINPKSIRPRQKLTFLKRKGTSSTLLIKGLQIVEHATLHFSFEKDDSILVGGIWFVAKLNGYKEDELCLFCEILYRYLRHNYSKDQTVSIESCFVVDVYSGQVIRFSQIEAGDKPKVLIKTLDEINEFL